MKQFLILCLVVLFAWPALATTPSVQEVTRGSGYTAWVIEDHYLPIVSIRLAFKQSGSAYDPEDKMGLAYLVSGLLDEGAGDLSSLDFRKRLEELATSLSFDTDGDYFYVSVKTLKENLVPSLELLNLALTKPAFADDAVTRIRNQVLTILKKKQESAEYRADRAFSETIFGAHPYGRAEYGTPETLSRITRADLAAFTTGRFTRQNIVISVVGDVEKAQVAKLLDRYLQLPAKQADVAELPAIPAFPKGQTIHLAQDIPQSVVIFGGRGVLRNDTDFYPAYLMNHILGGGGFESRLMNEVREKNGLAYTVYSYLSLMQKAGLFVGYVGSDNTKVEQSIALIKDQIRAMQKSGATEAELRDAKDYLIDSFPLKMTQNANLAAFLSSMQTDQLGMDFFDKRNSYVEGVTQPQIKAAAEKLLNVDDMVFIVVGGK